MPQSKEGDCIESQGDEGEEIEIPGCEEGEAKLGEELAKIYISVGALLNYLGPDRPEMQYSIKEVMRKNA